MACTPQLHTAVPHAVGAHASRLWRRRASAAPVTARVSGSTQGKEARGASAVPLLCPGTLERPKHMHTADSRALLLGNGSPSATKNWARILLSSVALRLIAQHIKAARRRRAHLGRAVVDDSV